jgi:hypothetical protein
VDEVAFETNNSAREILTWSEMQDVYLDTHSNVLHTRYKKY